MESEVKNYVHISKMETDDDGKQVEKHQAKTVKDVEKLVTDGKEFRQYSVIYYVETQFSNPAEFLAAKMPDGSDVPESVKTDIINRGWVLAQQATAKGLVLEDDQEFTVKEGQPEKPFDISGEAFAPKERRAKGTPETRGRKALRELLNSDPDKLQQLIAEFLAENQPATV